VGIEYSCLWDDTQKEDRMALCAMLQRLTKEMTAFRAALQGNRHHVPALMESIQLVRLRTCNRICIASDWVLPGTQMFGYGCSTIAGAPEKPMGATRGDQ
jgi:hypothetical protein